MQNNESAFDPKNEAGVLYQEALDMLYNPDSPRGEDPGEERWINRENCSKALPLLEMAISLDPENTNIRGSLGFVLKTLGRDDAALHHLKKALYKKPDDFTIRIATINLLVKFEKFSEAIPAAEKGTKIHPHESALWFLHAHCCIEGKQYGKALESAKKALETATAEDHTLSSKYKTTIVQMIHQAREGMRSKSAIKNNPPQPL